LHHAFNSPEWLAAIKQQYSLWPKHDRRDADRRESDRRSLDRRNGPGLISNSQPQYRQAISLTNILDDEEKAMIASLFAEDANAKSDRDT